MTSISRIVAAGLTVAVVTGAAFAASHLDPIVAAGITARQSHMKLYQHNIAVLGAMAQGNIDYDADAAAAAAGNLAALSTLNQSTYWPLGSDSASVEGTRALPAIWENGDDVMAKAAALAEAAAALNAVAGNGLAEMQAALGPVGQACGACHQTYRKRDDG